jgi:hypothetical protein
MNTATNSPLGAGGIIYNVTIKVDASIADDWLIWMLHEHIPAVMNTKCFTGFKVVKLMDMDETEGPTYAVQYTAKDMADYQRYRTEYAADLYRQLVLKWGQQLVWFETAMQVVH